MYTWFARQVTDLQNSLWYAVLLSILACLSVCLLLLEWWWPHDTVTIWWQRVDMWVAYLFLLDFFVGLFCNKAYTTKRAYWRDNWLNLISSIPITTEVTSVLRTLRIVRAILIIRAIRAGLNLTFAEQRRRRMQK
jgi:hypothetical protein